MDIYRKFTILIIFALASYLILRLYQKRIWLQKNLGSIEEPFSSKGPSMLSSSQDNELARIETYEETDGSGKETDGPGIINMPEYCWNLPLLQCCVKTSYDSCVTGSYVNVEMVDVLLKKGCRFLDFNVFSVDNKPVVASSTDGQTMSSKNSVPLYEVFQKIVKSAFSSPSPNPKDPMFIHLRINSSTKNTSIYSEVAKTIQKYISLRQFKGAVNQQTTLGAMRGKIVVIVQQFSDPIPSELENFVNMYSGKDILQVKSYTDLLQQATTPPVPLDSSPYMTNAKVMRMIIPSKYDSKNPNHDLFLLQYGVQFVANRFSVLDEPLRNYELLFKKNKSAFVPMATAILYTHRKNIDEGEPDIYNTLASDAYSTIGTVLLESLVPDLADIDFAEVMGWFGITAMVVFGIIIIVSMMYMIEFQ